MKCREEVNIGAITVFSLTLHRSQARSPPQPELFVFSLSPTLPLRCVTHKPSKDQIIQLTGACVILAKNNVASSGRTWSWLGEILYQHHLRKSLGEVTWEALILTDSREIKFSQFYRPRPAGYMFINLRQPFWPEHTGPSDPHLIVLYWLLIKMLFLIWTHWFIWKAALKSNPVKFTVKLMKIFLI